MKRLAWIAAAFVLASGIVLPVVYSTAPPEVLVALFLEDSGRRPLDFGEGATVVGDFDPLLVAIAASGSETSLARPGVQVVELDRNPRAKDDYHALQIPEGYVPDATFLRNVQTLHVGDGWLIVRGHPSDVLAIREALDVALGKHACGSLRRIHLRPVLPVVERPVSDEQVVGTPDPLIVSMVSEVQQAALQSTVQSLEDIGGRRYDSAGGQTAQTMIVAWFQALATPENGLTVTTQPFLSGSHDNVIATLPGAVTPEEHVIIGAHYDSICGCTHPYGADDNATGTATVLEAARILTQYQFERTLIFCTWGAEEIGLVGSDFYANQARQNGDDIYAYLNFDMNGYVKPGNVPQFSIPTNSTSGSLNVELKDVRDTYVSDVPWVTGILTAGSSDHASFTAHGFRATFPFEHFSDYSPYIHSDSDVIGPSVNDFGQMASFAELGVAALATFAAPFDGFSIRHEALGDTSDNTHSRTVAARVVASEGVQAVEMVWANGGSGEVVVPMTATANPDEYAADIPAHPQGVLMSYYIRATDGSGADETYPPGAPLDRVYYTMLSEELYFFDDMESGTNGWTHQEIATQDDWMLGPANEQGDNPYDPTAAWSGANVWGNDLNPPGFQGNYTDNVHNLLRSPSIDLSQASGSLLRYRRWLSVEDGVYDQATVEVNGVPVWQNPTGADFADSSWVAHQLDIAAIADGNPNVQVTYRLESDSFVTFGGWNLDDFEIYAEGDPDELLADDANPPLGTTIHLTVKAPDGANLEYELYASKKTTPGIDVDGERVLPLREDGTYGKVNNLKDAGHPWITDFRGTLDGNGESTAPSLFIPNRDRFSGARFYFSGLVRDGATVVTVLPFIEIRIQ